MPAAELATAHAAHQQLSSEREALEGDLVRQREEQEELRQAYTGVALQLDDTTNIKAQADALLDPVALNRVATKHVRVGAHTHSSTSWHVTRCAT